jgi:type I restriction-modification system DNA methylase subunit
MNWPCKSFVSGKSQKEDQIEHSHPSGEVMSVWITRPLLCDISAPFVTAIQRTNEPDRQAFTNILNELEKRFTTPDLNAIPADPKEQFRSVYSETKRGEELSIQKIATGIAGATTATNTDVLGSIAEEIKFTSHRGNQYFTPPNVARFVVGTALEYQEKWVPPTPEFENATGQVSLQTIKTSNSTTVTPDKMESIHTPQKEHNNSELILDPACGSGRLLLASTVSNKTSVILGWEKDPKFARMAAITLALCEIPGWIIAGDTIKTTYGDRAPSAVYRIPVDDPRERCKKSQHQM